MTAPNDRVRVCRMKFFGFLEPPCLCGVVAEFRATLSNGESASFAMVLDEDSRPRLEPRGRDAHAAMSAAAREYFTVEHERVLDHALVGIGERLAKLLESARKSPRKRHRQDRGPRGPNGSRD